MICVLLITVVLAPFLVIPIITSLWNNCPKWMKDFTDVINQGDDQFYI